MHFIIRSTLLQAKWDQKVQLCLETYLYSDAVIYLGNLNLAKFAYDSEKYVVPSNFQSSTPSGNIFETSFRFLILNNCPTYSAAEVANTHPVSLVPVCIRFASLINNRAEINPFPSGTTRLSAEVACAAKSHSVATSSSMFRFLLHRTISCL